MEIRSKILQDLALLLDEHRTAIIEANKKDMSSAPHGDIALMDRLKVDNTKVSSMIQSLKESAIKSNPEGRLIYEFKKEDGLLVTNKTVPFGTILIIYESRPDVTIEAAAMAFKSGNKILLKGGKEARNTNLLLTALWHEALTSNGYDQSRVKYLDMSREEIRAFISDENAKIDLIIPRGGDVLIDFVVKHAKAPVIISGRGNNFMYIHDDADIDMAIALIINGKERISVCNALDKVLINRRIFESGKEMSLLIKKIKSKGIEVTGDGTFELYQDIVPIDLNEDLMYEEFLAPKIMFSVVNDPEEAIDKINTYSGGHSAVIVTKDEAVADHFLMNVDCAAVYHNASTRFTDGGQMGFGGEMAISTQKLHFRGPVGIDQLVTNKWFIYGNGQIRN